MSLDSLSNITPKSEKKETKALYYDDNLPEVVTRYFEIYLRNHNPLLHKGDFYNLLISEIDRSLFETVLSYTKGNQSRTAEILGINRNTLRKKLKCLGLAHEKK